MYRHRYNVKDRIGKLVIKRKTTIKKLVTKPPPEYFERYKTQIENEFNLQKVTKCKESRVGLDLMNESYDCNE